MAGLVYYYDTFSHYYLAITYDEEQGRVLTVMTQVLRNFKMPIGVGVSLPENGVVYLRLVASKEYAQFYYSLDDTAFEKIGPQLDATVLSDDYYLRDHELRFSGAFIGICCQDLSGRSIPADFDFFKYTVNE